jgi:hypothetical protein
VLGQIYQAKSVKQNIAAQNIKRLMKLIHKGRKKAVEMGKDKKNQQALQLCNTCFGSFYLVRSCDIFK